MKRLLISLAIFLSTWLPVFLLSLPFTFLLLLTPWNGKTTWFGNVLYGRQGNAHTPKNPSLFEQWNFLALRNPISNFGKFTLSRPTCFTAWLLTVTCWRVSILYGWKLEDQRLPGRRAFVFRPSIR